MLALKLVAASLAVLVAVGLALSAGALLANRVPLTAPPGIAERLRIYLGSNVAETAPDATFPELRPLDLDLPAETVLERVRAACASLGWAIGGADPAAGTVTAVVVTPLLGFRDDVTVRVEALGEAAARVHVRSRSRVGRGDLGANLRHVLDVLDALRPTAAGG